MVELEAASQKIRATISFYRDELRLNDESLQFSLSRQRMTDILLANEEELLRITRNIKALEDKNQMIIEWPESEPEEDFLIRSSNMYFVDRERAALQLLRVHEETYNRSRDKKGIVWEYAICANDFGCGKTEFASKYISYLSELNSSVTGAFKVYPLLKKSKTLHIQLSKSTNIGSTATGILDLIKKEIMKKAIKFEEFSTSPRSLESFLTSLVVRSERPIFLVIDEVAAPFSHSQYLSKETQIMQTEKFRAFVGDVILSLVQIPGLFLLLCGRAPFLDWVGTRPDEARIIGASSECRTKRIVLNMIRPEKVAEILQNTFFNTCDGLNRFRLSDFFNLKSSSDLVQYANELFKITGGHPRTIVEVLLERCLSIEENEVALPERSNFALPNEGFLSSSATELLEETVIKFSKSSAHLISLCDGSPKRFDITTSVDGMTYENLLSPLRVGIVKLSDGLVRLCVPDRVRLLVESFVSPLDQYLRAVESFKVVPIDFPFAFELFTRKAFNHLFSCSRAPMQVDRYFFGSPIFGNWQNFRCANYWKVFPKVTGVSSNEWEEPNTVGYTISRANAMHVVRSSFSGSGSTNIWLLPRSHSCSPDLIHLSEEGPEKRILCISSKNYFGFSRLGREGVKKEIEKAENMIPDGEQYTSVLVIACTQYSESIQNGFVRTGFQLFPIQGLKLQEVILLNLCSPASRALFCGKSRTDKIPGLEILVEKTRMQEIGADGP